MKKDMEQPTNPENGNKLSKEPGMKRRTLLKALGRITGFRCVCI